MRCSRYRLSLYCSMECAKKAWPEHKKTCSERSEGTSHVTPEFIRRTFCNWNGSVDVVFGRDEEEVASVSIRVSISCDAEEMETGLANKIRVAIGNFGMVVNETDIVFEDSDAIRFLKTVDCQSTPELFGCVRHAQSILALRLFETCWPSDGKTWTHESITKAREIARKIEELSKLQGTQKLKELP